MAGKQKIYDESMRMATNFSWDREWANALKSYRMALQEFPDDAEALTGLATAYCELEQYESAIRALQKVLRANPANQDALNKMGETLERIGRFEEAAKTYIYAGNLQAKSGYLQNAIESWGKAVLADPDQIQARNNLAQAYVRQKQIALAIPELIALAAIYQSRDNNKKAAAYLQGALRLAPDDQFVQAALHALKSGGSIRSIQQDMAAQPRIQEEESDSSQSNEEWLSLSLDVEEEEQAPANPREQTQQLAMEELANVLFEDGEAYSSLPVAKSKIDLLIGQAIDQQTRGDIPKSIEVYKKIIQTGFERPAAYFVLGALYLKNSQYGEAIDYFNQAKHHNPYTLGVNFALGECFRGQNKGNEALQHLIEVLRVIDLKNAHRDNTPEFNQLYTNYTTAGDERKTLAFIDALLNFFSDRGYEKKIAEVRRSLGGDNGTFVNALVEFVEAPNTDVILAAMSDTFEYMNQNMFMTAIEACYLAIQKSPSYLPLHLRLAEIYMKQEMIDKSIQKNLAVAEVYNTRGNMDRVISIYQRILKIAPMDITVSSKLVELYIDRNDFDAALEQYKILADAYYQLAQIKKSLEKYREAYRLTPKSSNPKIWQIEILHRLGDIYTQRVDWANAAQVYEQLAQLSPEDDKALLSLVDLRFKLGESAGALAILDKVMLLYYRQNRQDKMLGFLEDMTQLRPNEMALYEKLASYYVQLHMNGEAIRQYDILGEMQLEAGLWDDAARTIQQIIDLGPDDPSGYKQLLTKIRGGI